MRLSIFGLGYVGTVSSVCFANAGHYVIGVDVNSYKVNTLNEGKSPITENRTEDLLRKAIFNKNFEATTDFEQAVFKSDVSILCVGTPRRDNGSIDMSYIFKVCKNISEAVRKKNTNHSVIIRSTITPGGTKICSELLNHCLENIEIKVCFNPEFLREGSAIEDFYSPPYTIAGTYEEELMETVVQLYQNINAPFYWVKPMEAELLKYASNAWHATKINFSNEIGRIGRKVNIDSGKVMKLLTLDDKLNVSSAYMKPGFAYGGSCLTKDVDALNFLAESEDLKLPLISSLNSSNMSHIDHSLELIEKENTKKVGLIGLSFKVGTDDLRNSPSVILAEKLLDKNYDLKIFDPFVFNTKLMGSNKLFVEKHIPRLGDLLVKDISELYDENRLIVVTHSKPSYIKDLKKNRKNNMILDIAGND